MMTKQQFIDAYIPAWLAGQSTLGYLDRCAMDKHYTAETIPIEDAFAEAGIAWEAYEAEIDRFNTQGGPFVVAIQYGGTYRGYGIDLEKIMHRAEDAQKFDSRREAEKFMAELPGDRLASMIDRMEVVTLSSCLKSHEED